MDKIIGIYKITNPEGKIYVGSSIDIHNRWIQHKYPRFNNRIGLSIKNHGYDNHLFEILEVLQTPEKILKRERFWQDILMSYKNDNLNQNRSSNTIYVNGKRKRPETLKRFFFLDVETGIYYKSLREISEIFNIKMSTLYCNINSYKGMYTNKTRFIKV